MEEKRTVMKVGTRLDLVRNSEESRVSMSRERKKSYKSVILIR